MKYIGRHRTPKDAETSPDGLCIPPERDTDPIVEPDTAPDVMFQALCPACNGNVYFLMNCKTWPDRNTGEWIWCQGCDTAVEYFCGEQYKQHPRYQCTWYYIHGLDPRNPGYKENEMYRPAWISGHQSLVDENGMLWVAPGTLKATNIYA